jgi:maltose alpha-D-glucosyltransferase/alpha-amylase
MDFTILDEWRQDVQWHTADAVLLCEANVGPHDVPKYCAAAEDGPNDRAHMMFNFLLNSDLWLALARSDAEPVVESLQALPKLPALAQWATFLRNHDELDLSRLTTDQRAEVMAEFAPKEDMRIYGRGIRRRLAPMLKGDRARMEMAYSLQFSMPGTPVLRYGEEIGMGEDLSLDGREAIRTPMQWKPDRNAGFSTAPTEQLVNPIPTRGKFSARKVNALDESRDESSLLRWFEQLIRVLRECPEIGNGDPSVVDVATPRSVLVHRFDAPEGSVLLLHNLADEPATVDLSSLGKLPGAHEVFSDGPYDPLPRVLSGLKLNGYGYRWIRLRSSATGQA